MDAGWPLVSIVFVVYNRRVELGVSLEHVLERLDYPPDRLEVIVVDNASTDGSAAMVAERFPQVRVIRNAENIGASAWNEGMTTARGEWRMILDDDCYITGDDLKRAVRAAEENRADLVSFLIASSVEEGYFNHARESPGLLGFWGCAAMFSRRAIEAEPFYDPYLFIWANEVELTIRLLDRGMRHLYLTEVTPVHQKELPRPVYNLRFAKLNNRHWAYAAGKLLRPMDALAVFGRLFLRAFVEAYKYDRSNVAVAPEVVRGFLRGLRSRRPVRPAVSLLYRRACKDFWSPFMFYRTPIQRLFGRSPAVVEQRRERWALESRDYFPSETAVLEV